VERQQGDDALKRIESAGVDASLPPEEPNEGTGEPAARVRPEDVLAQGRCVQIAPKGWSMYPLIIPGRDRVIVEPCDGAHVRRGDVVLFRRDTRAGTVAPPGKFAIPGDILVLHRVCGGNASDGWSCIGDNQLDVERHVMPSQVCGRLQAIVRSDGRRVEASSLRMRMWGAWWVRLLPVRPAILKAARWLRHGRERASSAKGR
jgi:hypothetical protein